jgi:tetratricopeptide (TPR) repeat protein
VLSTLQGTDRFLATLESAAPEFATLHASDSADDAALLWWLGWARYEQKKFAEAEDALSRAYAKNKAYLNSWYYIALARYQQKNYEGAFDALRRNWDENQTDLVASLESNKDANLAILDYLVGWAAQNDRTFAAGLLSEMQANASPKTARFWNNMGLFYRDAGEPLRASDSEDDKKTAMGYFETAYRAYSQAHELTPEDPSIMNDLAVMLHYYLDRDLERAAELYKKATERATAELARSDLSADLRSLYEIALRDSKNNLAKLERGDKRN